MNLEVKDRAEVSNAMLEAMNAQDKDGLVNSLQDFGDALALELREKMEEDMDGRILAARGIDQLTSHERKFADVVKAMANAKLNGVQMALTDTEVIMPETIINKVFEDITIEHPLLGLVDFQNTSYSTKWLMSTNALQKAVWGAPDAEATQEIAASFQEMNMTLLSLIAYIPVSWALLDLGPSWIVTYVVTILKEALANGLEDGIINGQGGKTSPVGLMMDVSGKYTGDLSVQTFTAKSAKKITKLDPKTYGEILDVLATTPNGNRRPVNRVALVVNPKDYFTKIYPAITVMGTNGSYVQHTLPFATEIVQSAFVEQGKAIAYIPNGYWMGLGQSGTAGKLMFSDDFKFTSRQRYYMIELYANGQPKDNNVAVVLDISGLKPAAIAVETSTEAGE